MLILQADRPVFIDLQRFLSTFYDSVIPELATCRVGFMNALGAWIGKPIT